VTAAIVADAGPLIGLGKIGRLQLLQVLYGMVLIPHRVHEELRVDSSLPGAAAAGRAIVEGWLVVRSVEDTGTVSRLLALVDGGEAEAIVLAHESAGRFLLVEAVGPLLDELARAGYRFSRELRKALLSLAGETESQES